MTNKFNAKRVYYHPRCGYFKGRQALDDYWELSKIQFTDIHKTDFQVFDSVFESEVHKLLTKWLEAYNKDLSTSRLLYLLTQVQVDLSGANFCSMSYKIDFFVTSLKPKGFSNKTDNPDTRFKTSGFRYSDLQKNVDTSKSLLIEAKGLFTAEARYKHLLLEAKGFKHGENIEIVQQSPQFVNRGSKCYKTISPTTLIEVLDGRFKKEKLNVG
jgi:hypothetical protein